MWGRGKANELEEIARALDVDNDDDAIAKLRKLQAEADQLHESAVAFQRKTAELPDFEWAKDAAKDLDNAAEELFGMAGLFQRHAR